MWSFWRFQERNTRPENLGTEMFANEEELKCRYEGKNGFIHAYDQGFNSAACYAIVGDISIDGVGTIINLCKINKISCMCTVYSLSLHSLYM